MRAVIDTCFYTFCDHYAQNGVEILTSFEEFYFPSIVYGELFYGFSYGERCHRNISHLNDFLGHYNIKVIEVDIETAKIYGEIYSDLRKIGKPIPTNDIWIAACTLKVNGTLLTCDKHFKLVKGLKFKNP
ncbi:MAG: type II toxin-antitoxin system VapC family toxin [Deltaproteobacteria bacterium]|nr:type II toxin-antitoxin system VapC family toxin [Deltaproteobacteria bacterium]